MEQYYQINSFLPTIKSMCVDCVSTTFSALLSTLWGYRRCIKLCKVSPFKRFTV